MDKRIVIVAPKTHSGITAVIENYLKGGLNEYRNIRFHPSSYECSGLSKLFVFLKQYLKALLLFLRFKPDLIHVHVSSGGSFYRKSCYVILAKLLNKKVIIHIHPTHFLDFVDNAGRIKRKYILKILNNANLIITLTNEVKNQLHKNYNLDCAYKVLPNPVYLKEYESFKLNCREKNMLLYLGWIIKIKGIYDLVSSVPLIRKRIKDIQLIVCGNKENEKLKKIVHENQLSDYVHVYEWIGPEEKKALLSKTSVLVLPSYSEGIPNVVLEAMACGTPIICTPVGGNSSVLKDKINCLFFNPGDVEDMTNKIVYLLENEKLQKEMKKNNLKHIKGYDAGILTHRLLEIYNQCCDQRQDKIPFNDI